MNENSRLRVIVGLSGGVDSSVAALVLKEQGYEVEGLFMKNWEEDDGTEYCSARADLADARAVCEQLEIPLHQANFAAEYWDNVFEYFLAEYRAGRTPNPDILCNREIKFKAFLDYAMTLGADRIATGHYARLDDSSGRPQLLKGSDSSKDQSYFLHAVPGCRLEKTLFPLGAMEKSAVRARARSRGLVTHAKKDSTGICFIGERRFRNFLETYIPACPGPIETDFGQTIGTHQGLMYHTIGQRQGLGIGGLAGVAEQPWYVLDKDLERNVLIVGQGNQHPRLFSRQLSTTQMHWIQPPAALPARLMAKIRYRQTDQPCQLHQEPDGSWQVVFDEPQRAVTPGQSVVFYSGDVCLGGGVIEARQLCHPDMSLQPAAALEDS
ncbi:MAG: tRNA 2-thiouridine(34) synthase MnmA [Kistimonas sp.]|nr:tRNA 2-thiouridine(34) synthase MnmA [Kistimonas sp.]